MSNWFVRIVLLLMVLVVLGLPIFMRPASSAAPSDVPTLVVITPHNEQIRYEIERAFRVWHEEHYGSAVAIDWRRLGGSTDTERTLKAQYEAAGRDGVEDEGVGYDLVFGGGDYMFNRKLKPGVTVRDSGGEERRISITQAIEIDSDLKAAAFPTQMIADKPLYDPEGHWWGVVLSSFGIVYNRDVLELQGLTEPKTWSDLADPRYFGWVALGDPAHSGSLRATYEAIVQRYGWDEGWATLRRVSANARYFAAESSQVPIDVSTGEVAAGMCVDFYGRTQALAAGGNRVGYVAPAGATIVNADPIAVLRGTPNRELAIRFVEFLLTLEGQKVWCFPVGDPEGPEKYELQRLPIRRDMYAQFADAMTIKSNPYEIAKELPEGTPSYFSVLPTALHAMAIDTHMELQAAWRAIQREQDPQVKAKMLELFDELPFTQEDAVSAGKRWRANPQLKLDERLTWTKFFLKQYGAIVDLSTS
jgi:iron(III) transport system substrate-binding protein